MSAETKPVVEKSPCIDRCEGCRHAEPAGETTFCKVYLEPAWKWELGQCNFATHVKREAKKAAFINPLKLAKMRARGMH